MLGVLSTPSCDVSVFVRAFLVLLEFVRKHFAIEREIENRISRVTVANMRCLPRPHHARGSTDMHKQQHRSSFQDECVKLGK